MSKYVLWRVLYAIPALLGVTVIIFVALRIMPGDPVSIMFGTQATKIRPEDRAKIETDLGLSAPLAVQYIKWLQDIGTGQLGKSFWRGDTVVDLIVQRGPLTVEIAVMAILHTGVAKAPLCNSGRSRCGTWESAWVLVLGGIFSLVDRKGSHTRPDHEHSTNGEGNPIRASDVVNDSPQQDTE